jgi:hypothetical protein
MKGEFMSTFNDKNGDSWSVEITVGAVKEVKKLLSIDLMSLATEDSNTLTLLCEDALTLVNVIYVVCKEQADSRGIKDEDFGRLFTGDAIEDATNALIEGITDFFPPRRRAVLAKGIQKMRELEDAALKRAESQIEEMDVDQFMESALTEIGSGI